MTSRATTARLQRLESPGEYPPATANAKDDEFDDASIDAKWSWVNQGGATIAEADGLQQLVVPANSGDAWRMRVQTAPSTPWTVTARIAAAIPQANFYSAGLIVRNSGSSKLIHFGEGGAASAAGTVGAARWTNSTTFSASLTGAGGAGIQYLRVNNDGTNLKFYVSRDGYSWQQVIAETLAAFISSVDQIGFGANANNTTFGCAASVYWFRVT